LKKLLTCILVLSLLMACVASVGMSVSADADDSFVFGVNAPASQDGSAQGQNGWYYMWSPETNKNGDLDVSKIQECVASESGSGMFAYGVGLYVDGTKGWIPDIYADDEYDCWSKNNWWLQGPDGVNAPAVADGPYATAIIGFKAPSDGCYEFFMGANAGNKDLDDADSDGLTLSINTAKGKLYSEKADGLPLDLAELDDEDSPYTNTAIVTVMLKKGEMIYFAADSNANGGNDDCTLEIEGEIVGKYFDVDNTKTFLFGGVEGTLYQDGSAQGQNGWYYMWSPETNKNGDLDVSKIKECVAYESGSAWFAYWVGLYVDGGKGWIPDIYADDEYDCWAKNNWWLQGPDGVNAPAVADGPYATAIIGFKAPTAGEYSFDLTAFAGNNDLDDPDSDGVTISIVTASGKLYTQVINADPAENKKSVTVELAKGEMIYFAVDPNANGGNDDATLQIFATLIKEKVEAGDPPAATAVETAYKEWTKFADSLPKTADNKIDLEKLTPEQKTEIAKFIELYNKLSADEKVELLKLINLTAAEMDALILAVNAEFDDEIPKTGADLSEIIALLSAAMLSAALIAVASKKRVFGSK